jgi:hypothetical protein
MRRRFADRLATMKAPPLGAEDLRHVACHGCGCSDPKCALVLNARCHPGRPTLAEVSEGVLEVVCAECAREVVRIALPLRAWATSPDPLCHPGGPVFVRYFKIAQTVEICCAVCDKPVVAVPLAAVEGPAS